MSMFSHWFKKKPRCQHYKSFGEDIPKNMVQTLKIDLEWKDSCSIYECKICGYRSFACHGNFVCSDSTLAVIEDYQRYRITLKELVDYFDKNHITYEVCNE